MADCVSVRIAYVTESFPPDVNGVAHTAVRVAEHLVSRGHEPLVIAPEPARGLARPDGTYGFPVVRVRSVGLLRRNFLSFRMKLAICIAIPFQLQLKSFDLVLFFQAVISVDTAHLRDDSFVTIQLDVEDPLQGFPDVVLNGYV